MSFVKAVCPTQSHAPISYEKLKNKTSQILFALSVCLYTLDENCKANNPIKHRFWFEFLILDTFITFTFYLYFFFLSHNNTNEILLKLKNSSLQLFFFQYFWLVELKDKTFELKLSQRASHYFIFFYQNKIYLSA